MKQPSLFIPLAVIALFFLFPLRAQAQHTLSYSSVDYDESTGLVSAYAQTTPDYNTYGYYGTPYATARVSDGNGATLAEQT